MDKEQDKRHFTRIPFEAKVTMLTDEHEWHGKLLDISLKGLLVSRPAGWDLDKGARLKVEVHAWNEGFIIRTEAEVAHVQEQRVGLQNLNIDIESITHLRRLVELNLGDAALIERELHDLIA